MHMNILREIDNSKMKRLIYGQLAPFVSKQSNHVCCMGVAHESSSHNKINGLNINEASPRRNRSDHFHSR